MKSLSRVRPSVIPWTAANQAPPSMGFSRQEYWSGVPLPSPVILLRWGSFQSSSSPAGPPSLKCSRAVGGPGWLWRLRFRPQRTRHSTCKAPLLAHPSQLLEPHSRPALGPNVLTYPSPIHLSPLVIRSFFSKTMSLFLFPGCIHLY